MLIEHTLFGDVDKVANSIVRNMGADGGERA